MSEKYPTCVHISALVLFLVIRAVASFEVVPIWLNHTLPAVLPHLKAVLERRFWNGRQLACRITLIVSMSSNRFPLSAIFNFGNIQKPKRAMSELYGGCRSCTILYFAKNCCTSFDECAFFYKSYKRILKNQKIIFSWKQLNRSWWRKYML